MLRHRRTKQSSTTSAKSGRSTSRRPSSTVFEEEWFRAILYSIGDAVITTDVRGRVLQMNPIAERLTGWKESEAQGKSLSTVFHIVNEKTRKIAPNPVQRVLREGIVTGLANPTLLIARDGTEYPIADLASPIKDSNGKSVGVVIVFRDQTIERNAERTLEKARDFAESIVATIREPLLVLDDQLEVVSANRSFLKVFQVTPEETIGKKVYDLGNRQWDIPKLRALLEDILPSNSHFDDFEVTHTFERIGRRTMLLNARRMSRDENRSPLILLAIEDITEKKQAEEAIRANEQFLRQIMQLSPVIIYKITPESFIPTWVSENITTLLGYSVDEALQPTWWREHIHPDDYEQELEEAKKIITKGKIVHEYRFFKKNGELIWVRDEMTLLRDDQGKPLEILGAWTDITESKRSEEALHESEERYRRISDLVSDYAYAFRVQEDRTLVREWVTDSFTRITGYTPQEVDNRGGWASIIYPDDMPIALERAKRLFAGQQDISEFRIVCKDGTIRWLRDHGYPVWDHTLGRIVRIYGAAQDITDRKKAEEEFHCLLKQYESFFLEDLTGDFISTPEGQIVACNPAFLHIFGFASKEEAFTTNLTTLFRSPEERQKLISQLQRYKKLEYHELEMVKRDGSPLYLIGNLVGHFDREGRLTEIQGYLYDDTKRRQLEEALRQAQKLESIGTLASGIAHDFNNILAIILGHASMLERIQQDREKVVQSIKAITAATYRGTSLVKQLLTFARKTESVFEPLEVNVLIKELAKMLYETFPRTIRIEQKLSPNLPSIIADATQIHQVLLNLCVNARDAMPKGGTLTLTTELIDTERLSRRFPQASAPRYVVLTVSDTGVGMDRKTLSRIFEPFFTTKAPGHGTGLGLSVVHGVVGAHNGFIDVESQPGTGTTFRVYLPAAEKTVADYEYATPAVTDLPGGTETILIAEDEENLRQVLEESLTTQGYTVISAKDGQQALELYRAHIEEIALVISDIGLPRLGGDELFRQIKQVNPDAKVILASGFIDQKVKSALLAAGVKEIINKPYTLDDVLLKTRKILDAKT